MEDGIFLNLIDQDDNRRASIVSSISEYVDHIEPYADPGELAAAWPRGGLLLVHDDGVLVDRILSLFEERFQWLPIVAYRQNPESTRIVDALVSGVIDYLPFPITNEAVRQRLATISERIHDIKVTRENSARAKKLIAKLSQREEQVLRLLASGMSNKDIAKVLDISPRTVEIHRANTVRKLGCGCSASAIRIAFEGGLAS